MNNHLGTVFYLSYVRINYNTEEFLIGPDRISEPFVLIQHPSKITIGQLKEMIRREHNASYLKVITPLEEHDDTRNLENWVQYPTRFQIENGIDAENKSYQNKYDAYGGWTINFYYNAL